MIEATRRVSRPPVRTALALVVVAVAMLVISLGRGSTEARAASWSTTYAGNGAAVFDTVANAEINVGSVFAYEYTQPWTAMAAIKMDAIPASAAIIFTNVNQPPFPGYEFWVNSQGKLQVRIIASAFSPGNTDNYIGVYGSTNVVDGQWHAVAATYDGSGKVAGVHIYLDGVEQTQRTIESDTLAGHSIVSPTHGPFLIGNQTGWLNQYYMRGSIDEFSLSKVAHTPAFIAQHASPSTIMPIDGNTVLAYHFDEGGGTVVHDASASHVTASASADGILVGTSGAAPTATATRTATATAQAAGTTTPTCTAATLSATPASPQPVGTPVTFTAQAQCPGAAEYEFWGQAPGIGWQLIRGYTASPALTTATAGYPAGSYTVAVHVRPVGGSDATAAVATIGYVLR